MNFVPCLSTVHCASCGAESHFDEMHVEHTDLCAACGDDLQLTIDAERAEDLLTDDEIVEALLDEELETMLVVDVARAS